MAFRVLITEWWRPGFPEMDAGEFDDLESAMEAASWFDHDDDHSARVTDGKVDYISVIPVDTRKADQNRWRRLELGVYYPPECLKHPPFNDALARLKTREARREGSQPPVQK